MKTMMKLPELARRAEIPYPTAARYAVDHADEIPHEGDGKGRRFPLEAVAVMKAIRRRTKVGRPKKNGSPGLDAAERARLADRLQELEDHQRTIASEIAAVRSDLRTPLRGAEDLEVTT